MAISSLNQRINRRNYLQLGIAALAGGSLTNLLRLRAEASDSASISPSHKRCILIWLDGGPSHFETFDPKPEAAAEIRGEFQTINTKTPSVFFSEYLQKLSAISDKLCIVRSICHTQNNHAAGNHYMITGAPTRIPVGCGASVSFHPSLGSVIAHERTVKCGLPAYFSMPNMNRSGGPNFLGPKYAPFLISEDPNTEDFRVRDMAPPNDITNIQLNRRRDFRKLIDRLPRLTDDNSGDPVSAFDRYYEQSYNLIDSPEAQRAFDISKESDSVRTAYGRNSLGQRMLLARRLVEAGVPFVTINDSGWDTHADIFKRMKEKLPPLDQALAALIEDLHDRGLLESTLVVALGEFGRTPKLSITRGATTVGRDHWSSAMSVLFAGGGVPGGAVLGATDKNGYAPVDRSYSPENFASTIYLKLGIDPGKILYTSQGRPMHLVSDPTPIHELMG